MPDPRAALRAIGELPDPEIDVADAALQLARVDRPDDDWQAARAHLSVVARDAAALAGEVAPDDIAGQVAALTGLIGGRHGYVGDTETYDDLANANMIQVVARRRGLPVALGIVWLHAARAAGWNAHGVDFPGHFLIGLESGGSKAVLDVFAQGRSLDARDLRALLKQVERNTRAELRPGALAPLATRGVLLRLQNNIWQRRLTAGDMPGAIACVEDMLLIAPDHAPLWRDAALMNQRLDRVAAALRCFDRFLALVPDGDAALRVRATMDELRTRLN